uniref:Putative ovule protein n=1 Tax=Solanum chacoense TaxID=4108 RepID=A0A0V0H147_SOLCH
MTRLHCFPTSRLSEFQQCFDCYTYLNCCLNSFLKLSCYQNQFLSSVHVLILLHLMLSKTHNLDCSRIHSDDHGIELTLLNYTHSDSNWIGNQEQTEDQRLVYFL